MVATKFRNMEEACATFLFTYFSFLILPFVSHRVFLSIFILFFHYYSFYNVFFFFFRFFLFLFIVKNISIDNPKSYQVRKRKAFVQCRYVSNAFIVNEKRIRFVAVYRMKNSKKYNVTGSSYVTIEYYFLLFLYFFYKETHSERHHGQRVS